MPSKLDDYLKNASPEAKASIERQGKILDSKGSKAEVPQTSTPQNESYKEDTGRDLDKNLGGYDKFNKLSDYKPIGEDVGKEAKEAAEPVTNPTPPKEEGTKDSLSKYSIAKEETHENKMGNDRMVGGMQQDEPER